MERSFTRFFNWTICYYRFSVIYDFLESYFYNYLPFYWAFFLNAYYSFSLSCKLCIWPWFLAIFSAFFSMFYLEFDSRPCLILSHYLFLSSKFYLKYWHSLLFSSNTYSSSYFSSLIWEISDYKNEILLDRSWFSPLSLSISASSFFLKKSNSFYFLDSELFSFMISSFICSFCICP